MKSLHSSSGSSSSDQTQGGDDWQAIELLSALRFDRWPAMAGLQAGLLPDRLQDSASHDANEITAEKTGCSIQFNNATQHISRGARNTSCKLSGSKRSHSGNTRSYVWRRPLKVSSPDQSLMEHPTLDLDAGPSRLQPAALAPGMVAPLATSSGSDGGGRGSQAGWSQDDPGGQGGARDEEAGGAAGGDEEGGSDKGWAALTTWLRSNLHQPRTAKRQILFVGHQQADTRQWHFNLNPNLSWCDVLPETKLRLRTLDQEVVMAFRAKYPTRPEHEWRRKCQRYRPPGAMTAIDVPMGDLIPSMVAIWQLHTGVLPTASLPPALSVTAPPSFPSLPLCPCPGPGQALNTQPEANSPAVTTLLNRAPQEWMRPGLPEDVTLGQAGTSWQSVSTAPYGLCPSPFSHPLPHFGGMWPLASLPLATSPCQGSAAAMPSTASPPTQAVAPSLPAGQPSEGGEADPAPSALLSLPGQASELATTLDGSTTASSRQPASHQRSPLTASGNSDPSADLGNTSQPQVTLLGPSLASLQPPALTPHTLSSTAQGGLSATALRSSPVPPPCLVFQAGPSHTPPPLPLPLPGPMPDPLRTPKPVAVAATTPGSGVDTDAPLLQQQYPAPYLPAWSHVLPQQPAVGGCGSSGTELGLTGWGGPGLPAACWWWWPSTQGPDTSSAPGPACQPPAPFSAAAMEAVAATPRPAPPGLAVPVAPAAGGPGTGAAGQGKVHHGMGGWQGLQAWGAPHANNSCWHPSTSLGCPDSGWGAGMLPHLPPHTVAMALALASSWVGHLAR